jgi:hypothetical protein
MLNMRVCAGTGSLRAILGVQTGCSKFSASRPRVFHTIGGVQFGLLKGIHPNLSADLLFVLRKAGVYLKALP